jgi:LmbE family N-acetylglucosaminyl deacetylase
VRDLLQSLQAITRPTFRHVASLVCDNPSPLGGDPFTVKYPWRSIAIVRTKGSRPCECKDFRRQRTFLSPVREGADMQKELVVLSPHMDDAVFDCCDHIFAWKRSALHVKIVTVFTAFSTSKLSGWARRHSGISPNESPGEFGDRRVHEDVRAMSALRVSWNHLGFTDAGFRCNKGKPIHPDDRSLFSGALSLHDLTLLTKLKRAIEPFKNENRFVVPLGVGNHVDHILVRKVAEELVSPARIYYYIEYPYAVFFMNWTRNHVAQVMAAKKSVKWMSQAKRRVIRLYASQHHVLSPHWVMPCYPEIILCPKDRLTLYKHSSIMQGSTSNQDRMTDL